MKVELVATPNRISTLEGALKYSQNFARICYSEKGLDGVRGERYNADLTEGRLIKTGHHSVFDHFNLSLYVDGLPKAMAMVLNNEPPYTTSEKSARYTEMSDIPGEQKVLFDKWKGIFSDRIDSVYPSVKGRDVAIKKLAQENARYLTSVFTPTKMGYTTSLRQLSILADEFEGFGQNLRAGNLFGRRIFEEGMLPFMESEVVRRFRVRDIKNKSREGVKLFGEAVEEKFGEDVYSTNLKMSFACLAQNHRHRTIHNNIIGDVERGGSWGYFTPPIIEGSYSADEWKEDMKKVSEEDFPQGQIVAVAEEGRRKDLEMKSRERNCGLPQLEIVRVLDGLLERYSEDVPEIGKLRGANCLVEKAGCGKGGCAFGPEKAVSRLI